VVKTLLLIFLLLMRAAPAHAEESGKIYRSGVKAARQGDEGYAEYAAEALFASAEYYFEIGDLADARLLFLRFVNDYPEAQARPFALAYLAKMARSQSQEDLARSLDKEIVISQQLVLLFREFKEFQYVSALNRKYRAVHFIDRIEFYRDGELFEQISY
jgi:hypothetical protein